MKKLLVVAAAAGALCLLACGPGDGFDAGDEADAGHGTDAAVAQCPTTGGACTVGPLSSCQGDLLLYCDASDKLACDNCKTLAGGPFSCAEYNATYGYECLHGVGQSCSADFPTSGEGCLPSLTCNASNKCE